MSEPKFTPGPLRYDPGTYSVVDQRRIATADLFNLCLPDEEQYANGVLYAAAPDMYAALEWLTNLGRGVGRAGGTPEPGEMEDALDAGAAALAKANGTAQEGKGEQR